ncbi:MAG: zinc-binding dehydrogenase [Clostridiales Family XIII bacterium]|jgi:L-iditol 2-dehydrogenase|nr:zinc-binding dehydrogenase [Clostridiales Family XIII bacterium]
MFALQKYAVGEGNVRLTEVERPKPGSKDALIKVKACGICGTDIHIYKDDAFPFKPPVILGHEASGVIEELGADVDGLSIGDPVISETYYYTCGECVYCKTGRANLCEARYSIGSGADGAMAEYVKVPAKNLHLIPKNISFVEAALTEPLTCCVHAVFEKATLKPSDTVLLSGPGAIGLLCLQVVKLFGCRVVVTGTKKDEERLEIARELGADLTLYAEDSDTLRRVREFHGGPATAFECSGAVPATEFCLETLPKGGRYVQIGLPAAPTPVDLNSVALKELTITGAFATKPIWWLKTIDLMSEGKINLKRAITDIYKLSDWEKGFQDHISGKGVKHVFDIELGL